MMTESVRRSYLLFFFVAVAVNLWMIRHFLVTLATAASIAVLLSSLFERLAAAVRGRRSLAAGIATALIAIVILVPISAYGAIVGRQAVEVYERLHLPLPPGALSDLWGRELPERYPWLRTIQEYLGATSLDGALGLVAPVLTNLAGVANRLIQSALTGVFSRFSAWSEVSSHSALRDSCSVPWPFRFCSRWCASGRARQSPS
jgi:predicted PurR-regulated permease PerM